MKKRIVINLFLILGLIFILGFISAGFEIGDLSHAIDNQYGPSTYIQGWINISLDKEPTNSVFEDSFGNSISLIDLINTKANENFEYDCSTMNCAPDYSVSNAHKTKTFELENRESKFIGFKFTGNIIAINSINFSVESDAASSCYNQIEIDFFNDRIVDKGNNKALSHSTSCSFLKSYGCFNNSKTTTLGTIGSAPYCQRIHVSESPGFKLGAWVKDSKNLVMALYDGSVELANCELPETTGEKEIFCNINYLVAESKDYYVCIYSNAGTANSKIRGYSDLNGCGFQGMPAGNHFENTAYQIFAEGQKFAAVETLGITNSLPYGNNLADEISDYLLEKYGSLDCSANECVVPIKFISGLKQTLTVKDLLIKYDLVGFSGAEENNFYDLTEIPASINSEFQKLYLNDGNFSVPNVLGKYLFPLSLNNEEILSEEIIVEEIPIIQNLIPITTASAFPTLFKIIVHSSGDIIEYVWDFENDIKVTATNKITYTYNSTGQYKLKVTVTDSNQRSSYKIFNILVNSPEEIITKTLKEKLEDLTDINAQIKEFELFCQDSLNSVLNIKELEDTLKQIQKDFKPDNSESKNNDILTSLLDIKIPESIGISKSADSISFYPDKNNIDLEILKTIGKFGYDANNEDEYPDAILAWNQKNIETKISFKELVARYESSDEPILNTFELKISEKNGLSSNFYLFFHKLENLEFQKNYGEKEESGYVYIELTEPATIAFSTTEDIDFTDLPVFISPEIRELLILENTPIEEDEEKISKWKMFILIIFLLIIVGIVTYIVLQEWYKKKYESYLFKNQNSLYNLITYIENAKKRGLKNKEISVKLKKSGWNSEQIRYVMRKYSGKRTGMFEIPIEKILSKFKKKKVQQKRPIKKNFSERLNTEI